MNAYTIYACRIYWRKVFHFGLSTVLYAIFLVSCCASVFMRVRYRFVGWMFGVFVFVFVYSRDICVALHFSLPHRKIVIIFAAKRKHEFLVINETKSMYSVCVYKMQEFVSFSHTNTSTSIHPISMAQSVRNKHSFRGNRTKNWKRINSSSMQIGKMYERWAPITQSQSRSQTHTRARAPPHTKTLKKCLHKNMLKFFWHKVFWSFYYIFYHTGSDASSYPMNDCSFWLISSYRIRNV